LLRKGRKKNGGLDGIYPLGISYSGNYGNSKQKLKSNSSSGSFYTMVFLWVPIFVVCMEKINH